MNNGFWRKKQWGRADSPEIWSSRPIKYIRTHATENVQWLHTVLILKDYYTDLSSIELMNMREESNLVKKEKSTLVVLIVGL